MSKTTMSKFCRLGDINLMAVSKGLDIPLKELNRIYLKDECLFQNIIMQSWKTPGLLTYELISKIFNVSGKTIQAWRLKGLNAYYVYVLGSKKNHLKFNDVCEFISSGRA